MTVDEMVGLREHCPSLWARADRFVTPQALLARAFGAQEWVTDACDGAWWLVHDAVTLAPDPLLEDLFALTHSRFPRLAAPGTPIGAVSRGAAAKTGLPAADVYFDADYKEQALRKLLKELPQCAGRKVIAFLSDRDESDLEAAGKSLLDPEAFRKLLGDT